MRIDISSILSGEKSSVQFSGELDSACRSDIVGEGVEAVGPITVCGEVKGVGDYMFLNCVARITYKTFCARCMCELDGLFEISLEKGIGGEDEDCLSIENGFVDCSDAVYDEILLNFPTKFLCKPDCLGLCSECGADFNQGTCSCKKSVDPRMAPLLELLKDKNEEK